MTLKFKFWLEIIIVVLFGVGSGLFGARWENSKLIQSLNLELLGRSKNQPVIEEKKVVVQENKALIQSIQQVKKSVIPIGDKNGTTTANGFFLTRDGLVVTLSSCLPPKTLSDKVIGTPKINFQILKRSLHDDLALLKIKGDEFKTVDFSNEADTVLGERIFVLSSVFYSTSTRYVVNQGIITEIKPEYYSTNISSKYNLEGSPCFNIKGDFIGLAKKSKNNDLEILPFNIIKSFSGL